MPDLLHHISIGATPQHVLATIATEPGLRSWWTADCTAKPEVGYVNVFRFDRGNVEFHFRVDEQSPRHIAWTCIKTPRVPDYWVNTQLVFDLEESDKGTSLRFSHRGWRSAEGAYAECNTVWGEMMHRLRAHAEGKPTEPYFAG